MKRVLVGCCAYQGKPFNEVWLETLLHTTQHLRDSVDILFIDNGCTDGTFEAISLLAKENDLEIKRYPTNMGICTGWNAILDHNWPKYDYFAITNNDIAFGEGWLDSMLEQMERHPLVGRMHTSSSDEPEFEGWRKHRIVPNTKEEVYEMLSKFYGSLEKFHAFSIQKNEKDKGKTEERYAATSFILRREVVRDIGFYDQSFAPSDLHEDLDFDKRMDWLRERRKDGKWINRWSKEGYVHHFVCQTRTVHLPSDDWVSAREHGHRTKYGSGSGLCDNNQYKDWCQRMNKEYIP